MVINEVRFFLNVKSKEHKTEMENLYLKLRSYNFIAGSISVQYSKRHYDKAEFLQKRKDNYLDKITSDVLSLIEKYKEKVEDILENSAWEMGNITFEEVFAIQYKNAIENIKKDKTFLKRYNVIGDKNV